MKLNIKQCSKMLFIDNNKKDKSILILNVEVIRKLLSLTLFCTFHHEFQPLLVHNACVISKKPGIKPILGVKLMFDSH